MKKATDSGVSPRLGGLLFLLAAHSGGARNDDPDNNTYEYYRQNSDVSLGNGPASVKTVLSGCHVPKLT